MSQSVTLVISAKPKGASHRVCKLNPQKRGSLKWETMFFVSQASGLSSEQVTEELVRMQRIKQREVDRDKIRVLGLL